MAVRRGLTQATIDAISAPYFYITWLVFIDWPSGPIRAHSGTGTISFDGSAWLGVGNFGSITIPEETSGLSSFPAEFSIVGLPDSIQDYLDEDIRNRAVEVFGAIVSEAGGNNVVGTPFEIWSGYMDAMAFSAKMENQDGTPTLSYGLRLEARGGPTIRSSTEVYHTAEDQESKYPGDTAGRLVINAEAEGSKLTWPES